MAHTSRALGVSHLYPRGVCRAILKGATEQMKADRPLVAGCYGAQGATDDAEAVLHSQGPTEGDSGLYRDDLTGQVLKDSQVIEARRVELAFFHSKGVWTKQPLAIAKHRTGRPPITVR